MSESWCDELHGDVNVTSWKLIDPLRSTPQAKIMGLIKITTGSFSAPSRSEEMRVEGGTPSAAQIEELARPTPADTQPLLVVLRLSSISVNSLSG